MKRSWKLPSTILFTVSDPNSANGHKNVETILQVFRGDERPDWRTTDGAGRVYQAEGQNQADDAVAAILADRQQGFSGDVAVVTTLGINPKPFLDLGVSSVMVECYAQAGDFPYGDIPRMRWQAKHDGWQYVIPVLGVYDGVSLQHYIDLNGGSQNFKNGHWRGGPLAIYLAEGMGDTGSWETLASL